ncbi:MAG: methionyl-tRNA formyltransferase [Clostridiales bacterium]|nr:methionyl-tRNA formyltransferase [Clostridiales bacterium]
MKIVFMGTPDFAVPTLDALVKVGHEVGLVVTQPDRARNRNQVTYSPVKEAALKHGIDVLQPEKLSADQDTFESIESFGPDAIIVVAYGQFLKKDMLDLPKYGCLNVHGSLLPKLRGASPMQQAILEGDEETGVTIMKMAEGMDSGDMIAAAATPVDHKNFEEIHDELAAMGAKLLVDVLPTVEDGTAMYTPQNEDQATFAGLIKKSDGRIDFSRSAEEVDQLIRAFDPWPGAFCQLDGKTVKFWKAESMSVNCSEPAGSIVKADEDGLCICCGGSILCVKELQMPGKKRVACGDFLRGHKIEKGTLFN